MPCIYRTCPAQEERRAAIGTHELGERERERCSVIENANDAWIGFGRDGRVTLWNRAAARA